MTVRCNLIIALRSGDQSETDTFMEGETTFKSCAVVENHVLETVEDMEEDDWIAFCVIPSDFAATNVVTPLAYQGCKPSNATLASLGLDMVRYLGRCESAHEGDRCTEYRGHEVEEPAHVDEQGEVWFDEEYAARILGG